MNKKILYVEDNKFDRLAFERYLRDEADINFTITGSIEEARKIISEKEFDIIITDYSLADGTAFDVLDLSRHIPVVVTTGTGSEEIAVKLMRAGAKDYLIKDIENNYLKILPVVIDNTLQHIRDREALIKSRIELEQSRDLKERQDIFMGIASHELKTPLTSIKAYIQLIKRMVQEGKTTDAAVFLDKTDTNVSKLQDLINELLDISKIQSSGLRLLESTFDFDELVTDVINSMKHTVKQTIVKEGGVNSLITADKQRLEQVLLNYITNAAKYSPEADKIIVDVKEKNNSLVVSVKDFGIGIPEKELHKIFGRFYRVEKTSQKFSGLGIGLYISSEIIRKHGGDVSVESEEGKGSTFTFTLPIK